MEAQDEAMFNQEEVDTILNEAIETVLANQDWDEKMVPQWINDICERSMKELNKAGKPYKYAITVMLQEMRGAGVQTTHSCYWENYTDGMVVIQWPSSRAKDNQGTKGVQCIATIFAV